MIEAPYPNRQFDCSSSLYSKMASDDESDITIDLFHMLENDEEVVVNALNKKNDSLSFSSKSSFDDIFEDEVSEGIKSPIISGKQIAFENPLPPVLEFEDADELEEKLSMFNQQDSVDYHNNDQSNPFCEFNTGRERKTGGIDQYDRNIQNDRPATVPENANLLDPKTFEQNFMQRRNNLWKSMEQSELSTVHIDQVLNKKIGNGTNSVASSRRRLRASFDPNYYQGFAEEVIDIQPFNPSQNPPRDISIVRQPRPKPPARRPSAYVNGRGPRNGGGRGYSRNPANTYARGPGNFSRRKTWHAENMFLPPAPKLAERNFSAPSHVLMRDAARALEHLESSNFDLDADSGPQYAYPPPRGHTEYHDFDSF